MPYAARLHVGDLGKRGEVLLEAVRRLLEGALGDVAVEREPYDALPVGHLANLGALGAGRESLDPVDGGLDVVESAGNASCTRPPIDTSPAATMKNIRRLAATPCLAM